ncbi:MAG: methyltransferase domain-containing protein [Solirubrobacteraceae bacterium]
MISLPGERRRLQEQVDAVPFWFHSIDLGGGVVTPGHKSPDELARELDALALPDLRGKSVLDIGGWDGFFAFEAERRGAARVGVVDHYMWAMDAPGQQAYWRRCMDEGVAPRPYHETEFWHPDTLPGKRGFDLAREVLGSAVEAFAVDFMDCDLGALLGRWDVVLYLGVLYHMEDPLRALRRVAAVTRELAVVETEAVVIPGFEHEAIWRFFPGAELNGDVSNWWAPNLAALGGALTAAGFASVRATRGPARELAEQAGGPHHYRATVHALK